MFKSAPLSQAKQFKRNLLIIVIAWTIAIAASLLWNFWLQSRTTNDELRAQVEAIHTINMQYRNWIIHNGGVYVPVTDKTPPSLWLSHVPERDITTPSGKQLTLLNSSYALRLVQQMMEDSGANVRMHISSMKPINPVNVADPWEQEALKSFAQGAKEKASIDVMKDGKSYYRYMKPMVTDQYCLKCHAAYGDKLGDIRGGVSVSLPVDSVMASVNRERKALALGHGLIWGLGLAGLFIGARRQKRDALAVEKSEAQVTLLTNSIAHAIYGVDLEGRCTFANDACVAMLGYKQQSELLGKDMHELMHHSHKDGSRCSKEDCKILAVLREGKSSVVEHEVFLRKNGSSFPVSYWSYPVILDGSVQGAVVTFMDISDQLSVKDELKRSQALLDSVIENIPVMVFLKRAQDLRFELFNKAGAELLGQSRQDLIGKNDYDLFPREQAEFFIQNDRAVLESHKLLEIQEEPLKVADGSNRWLHTFKIGLYDQQNQPSYLLGISLDITDRKLAEDHLRESESKLAAAQRMAHLGSWEQDITSNTLVWSEEVCRIFEIDTKIRSGLYAEFLSAIHPEDREAVNFAYTQALKLKTHAPYQSEYRLLMKDGRIKYLLEKSEMVFDEHDRPVLLKGTVQDVTALKQAERALREHQKVLEQTLEGTIHTVTIAVELRDPYTAGHQRRVADLACSIAREMKLDEERIHGVRLGAMIHDIGKIGIPVEILSKPTQLTDLEMLIVREHAVMGYNILKDVQFPWPIADIAHQHHERIDGSGYPNGLKGEEILLEARIVAVADVLESMASHRPYRPSRGMQSAMEEIQSHSGTLYDAAVVEACVKVVKSGFEFV